MDNRNRWKNKAINAQGTRVLAKMIAAGLDPEAAIFDNKTVQDLSEENNTLFHLQTVKDAKAMASEFSVSHARKVKVNSPTGSPDLADPESSRPESSQIVKQSPSPQGAIATESAGGGSSIWNQAEVKNEQLNTDVDVSGPSDIAVQDNAVEDAVPAAVAPQVENQSQAANQAQALLKEQADFLIEQAYVHIENLRLKTPKTNSALGSLEQLRRIDSANPAIAKIERAIGEKYLELSSAKVRQGKKSGAQQHLDSAKQFITDDSVLADHQLKVDNTRTITSPTAAATTEGGAVEKVVAAEKVQPVKANLICDPDIKAVGVPLLGRTMTVRQSLPLARNHLISTSKVEIAKAYINLRDTDSGLYFEQARKSKGPPIKFDLSVRPDGNNHMLTIVAKVPAGLAITKAGGRKAFCELLAAF